MRLKKLSVQGFKSFADRTDLIFDSGMVCVVGPNGCGKSNVIDAVKWVLGEQRPTSLRGKEMTDVIFNGTDRRPPLGMAEGSLTFDNRDRQLPVDEDEVTVMRRLFRSGEGEYFINKRSVRLKDLRDVFLGTGLVPGGYAFMEQGKIDSVLASNPVERRRVFEEAAGISRFRLKKRESELKLEKVTENLTRLKDIIEEVGRQVRSLKVQAGKARHWQEINSALRDLQAKFNLHRFHQTLVESADVDGRVALILGDRELAQLDRERRRLELAAVELELRQIGDDVANLRGHVSTLASQRDAAAEKAQFHQRHAEELVTRIGRRREEAEAGRGAIDRFRQERVVVVHECEDLTRDRARIAGEVQVRTAELKAAQTRADELERDLAVANQTLRDAEQRRAHKQAEQARLQAQHTHLDEEIARSTERGARLDAEREALRRHLDEKSGLKGEHARNVDDRRRALGDAELGTESREQLTTELAERVRVLDSERSRVQSRSEVLESAVQRREGLDDGARAVLAHRAKTPDFLPGFRGLLLDLFEVDLAEARAVEAALGDAVSALVVGTMEEALEGIRFLREKKVGGAVFLPLDRFRGAPTASLNGIRVKDAGLAPVLSALVGGIEVVPAATLATRLAGKKIGPLLVSTDGDVVRDGRVVTLPRGRSQAGLVVHQAELKELKKDIIRIDRDLATARTAWQDARAAVEAARLSVRELSVALVREEGDAARLDQEVVRIGRELERLAQDDHSEQDRRAQQRAQRDQVTVGLEAIARELDAAAATVAACEEARRDLQQEVEAAGVVLRRQADAVQNVRLEEVRIAERLGARVARERHLAESITHADQQIAVAVREAGEDTDRSAKSRVAAQDEETRVTTLGRELDAENSRLALRVTALAVVQARLETGAGELADLEKRLDTINEELSRARGREAELRTFLDGLVERTRDELALDLRQIHAEGYEEERLDWDAIADQMRELKERLGRLGNVNLAAIDELVAAETRAGFLAREEKDLITSQESLKDALKSIEKQSTVLFLDTFNAVREHFAVIFRKLFSGGKAEILLEDEANPLESGIEIRARPPGKELRSITLLSGGERTMTAVALLFSVLRANPTPCALLDEVDAALDEDNTERFGNMLDEFLAKSQFLIVSHSKRTMDKAGLLIGVTMPERGVSRRVAVRLEQIGADGTLHDVEAVNRAARNETQTTGPAAPAPEDVVSPMGAAVESQAGA